MDCKLELKALVGVSKRMRDNAGYYRKTRQHLVSSEEWQTFCKQLRWAEEALEKHGEGVD